MIYGKGYNSGGEYKTRVDDKLTKPYRTWCAMLKRCYNEKYHAINPTYRECTVCDEWLDYQVFAHWFNEHYIEGFDLDKDIRVEGNKIYAPQFCQFVTREANTVKANAKHYTFLSPCGNGVAVYNLSAFCKANGLTQSNMSCVASGKRTQHKGWRIKTADTFSVVW